MVRMVDADKLLRELEQRKAWREESAAGYSCQGDAFGAAWYSAEASGYAQAIYSLRHYHLGEPI